MQRLMPLAIRPMTASDISAIHRMQERAFGGRGWSEDALRREVEDSRISRYYVLEEGGEPAGMFGCWVLPGEVHLVTICIEPGRQRHGLGELLVRVVMRLAGRYEADVLRLEVRASNGPAIRLYERLGFSRDGRRRNLYGNPVEDGVLMNREVPGEVERRAPAALRIDWGGEVEAWDEADVPVYSAHEPSSGVRDD